MYRGWRIEKRMVVPLHAMSQSVRTMLIALVESSPVLGDMRSTWKYEERLGVRNIAVVESWRIKLIVNLKHCRVFVVTME